MAYINTIARHTGEGKVSVSHGGDEVRRMYGAKKDGATRRKREQEYLLSLTIEQLQEASLEKAPNGCATELAIKAQRVLYQRIHHQI